MMLPPCAFDQQIDCVADQKSCGIQNQIIDIAGPAEKGELQNFNGQGSAEACGDDLEMGIQLFENRGPDNTQRDEHGGVANEVQQGLPPGVVVEEIDKRPEIYPEGEDPVLVEEQRQGLAVHFAEGTEGEADHHQNTDIDQEQGGFPFEVDAFIFQPADSTDHLPDKADENEHMGI